MRAFWGLALVLFGLGYMGAGLGWWGYDVPSSLWQFWPLILVFWGLDLLTKNTTFYVPVMIIAVILSGAFVYITLFNQANNLGWGMRTKVEETEKSQISASLPEGAESTKVVVETGAVDFNINGGTKELLSGESISNIASPKLSVETEGNLAKASLTTESDRMMRRGGWWMAGRGWQNKLTLALNETLPLELLVKSGASKLDFDLSKYQLSKFNLESGASTINVEIGDSIQNNAILDFKTGASSIDVNFPESVGVKITAETGLSSQEFTGYSEKDGVWYSKDYEKKLKKIELKLSAGASSIKVH